MGQNTPSKDATMSNVRRGENMRYDISGIKASEGLPSLIASCMFVVGLLMYEHVVIISSRPWPFNILKHEAYCVCTS